MSTRLVADSLCKSYGRQTVLDGVSFSVSGSDRIGLIGRNGTGKTTLLRILAGQEEADSGQVTLASGTRLGVLDQHEILPDFGTGVGYLEARSGRPEWECRRLAARFGLGEEEIKVPPGRLSGGYQMRMKLVRLLLADPNLLLLDEPVNYLDLPTLIRLEGFLKQWSGALVITSHDRELLQNLCRTTWEVARGRLAVFSGDVETYLDWKEEQEEYARRTNKKLRREIAHHQEFVDRFRSKASLATRAQSKVKHIAKLRSKLQAIESDLPTAGFRLNCAPFVSGTAFECQDLAIGYGPGTTVAKGIGLDFPRGAKVGIVGENGRGKTTLLRTMAGILSPLAGRAKWWHRADIGYFSQMAEDTLLPHQTVLSALYGAAPPAASGERILATAGTFLFREDDLEKPVRVLSGGERSRLRLAILTLRDHNVLLLDEPSNHLDAETTDVLARSLREFPGTVVVVSHARTFMNALVDRLYEVRNGSVRQLMGTYEDYVEDLTVSVRDDGEAGGLPNGEGDRGVSTRKEIYLETRRRQREIQKLERRLTDLEREKGQILRFFFENPTEYDPEKQRRLGELEDLIGQTERDWLRESE